MDKITYQEAEKILNAKLDRRKTYYYENSEDAFRMFGGGPIYTYGEWTQSCSGCRETEDGYNVGEYPWDEKNKCWIGAGCSECGYTGKRRDGWYAAVDKAEMITDGKIKCEKVQK